MDDGAATETGGSDDRHDTPRASNGHHGLDVEDEPPVMKFPWSITREPASSTSHPPSSPGASKDGAAINHKRSFSGNLLARLNFMRSSSDIERPALRERPKSREQDITSPTSPNKSRKTEDDPQPVSPPSPRQNGESAMVSALKQQKTRKRKGSLRKTALLGGRVGRERKGSFSLRSPTKTTFAQSVLSDAVPVSADATPFDQDNDPPPSSAQDGQRQTSKQFHYESSLGPDAPSSNSSTWSIGDPTSAAAARLSLFTEARRASEENNGDLASPLEMKSPASQTSQTSYISTTDDDDALTFGRPSVASHLPPPVQPLSKPPSVAEPSYFPAQISRKRSSKRSPLSRTMPMTPSPYLPVPEPHDYTETSYWGWIILIITWITFTVGMGSCLEVWSWAWDVGETPYAPPELEDDPTLPIVGYYPALIVLTGVVAWVWVAVAWVGMKYFRHAKIEV